MSLPRSGRSNRRLRGRQIFGAPIAIGTVALAGLVIGLLGAGGWDVAAAFFLAIPLLTLAWLRFSGRC